jgi:transcriptional regulator with XRE-family HTH domain
MKISSSQARTARTLLGWTQQELAGATGLSATTISMFESNLRRPSETVVETIRTALESAGVLFVEENGEGRGVRLRKGK